MKFIKSLYLKIKKWILWNIFHKRPTIKPEGTSSVLSQYSSGIHPTYQQYYIRKLRQ